MVYIVKMCLKGLLAFIFGFIIGQVYYFYLLKDISFPYEAGHNLSLICSFILGVLNVSAIQIRCISLLTIPLYCGKPGRGVLKAIILTYVVAGPISNMIYNATEVVRLFACTTELNYNMSKAELDSAHLSRQAALLNVNKDLAMANHIFSSILNISGPVDRELDSTADLLHPRRLLEQVGSLLQRPGYPLLIDTAYESNPKDSTPEVYLKRYKKKLTYRCESVLATAAIKCSETMANVYGKCYKQVPEKYARFICQPLAVKRLCNVAKEFPDGVCDFKHRVDPGIGEGYFGFKITKELFIHNFSLVHIFPTQTETANTLSDVQDAKETGRLVIEAFNEKLKIMYTVITVVYVCVALLFLRIVSASITYHDLYLSEIDFDNYYVTGYFKKIDERRMLSDKLTLLPLKKMERSKYTDVMSFEYGSRVREKLVTQILKLSFDVVTATTFVMLDRLFYEALDVVRLYAVMEEAHDQPHDFDVKVVGTGLLAKMMHTIFKELGVRRPVKHMSNKKCLPKARLMPAIFFFKIYGGFLWILFLLIVNPFTIRLRRLTCSYFYPRREKQRILHLYNDILKKRMKMEKTLRTKAVQAVRAHYLSAENLISLRMKYPHFLGWLRILPAARMSCLICGETEPNRKSQNVHEAWHSCSQPKCPFVYCAECWREVGARCIACEPSRAEISDVNSLTEDDNWK